MTNRVVTTANLVRLQEINTLSGLGKRGGTITPIIWTVFPTAAAQLVIAMENIHV